MGLRLILWGLFKKMVLADNLAIWVDRVFDNVYSYHGFSLILATFAFSIQIYCDFSGYSDIARGVAKLMGINLVKNFKSPYLATSINDFWKRWHISLTNWFRDYVYIPLGGNRVGKIRKNVNILITFLVSGLWHGAAGHFVVWGGVHGGYRIVEDKVAGKRSNKFISNVIRGIIVFFLVSIAWCFFRTGIRESLYVLSDMWAGINHPINYFCDGLVQMNIGRVELIRNFLLIGLLFLYDAIDKNNDAMLLLSRCNIVVRWAVYYAIIGCILLWGLNASSTEFIYFQF